jgi:hypothetical protein
MHDLKVLNQKLDNDELDLNVKINSNFHIMEDTGHVNFKMIETIDDLVEIVRTTELKEKEMTIVNAILKGNDLTEFVFQLKNAGYEPWIKKQGGRISVISIKLKTLIIVIKTQTLVPDTLDGDVSVSSENVYNNMNKAYNTFYSSIFKTEHLSFYSNQDSLILDENRTVVPFGRLQDLCEDDLVEIDIGKAFSAAFSCIDRIPIFNEFDSWKIHSTHNVLSDFTLYTVYTNKPNLFFNKKYNLVYGFFLKHFINSDIKILYYKEPSFIKPVKYNKILQKIFNTKISKFETENKYLQKMIAVVNFGLLEKGVNRNQNCFLFETREEAQYYQAMYGGSISKISKYEVNEYLAEDPLDYGTTASPELTKMTNSVESERYYILHISAQKDLTNGFRYIKELLLNYHNFKMYTDYEKLKNNNIDVFSVKTDAFTIKQSDVEKAKEVISFYDDIGGWRVFKD